MIRRFFLFLRLHVNSQAKQVYETLMQEQEMLRIYAKASDHERTQELTEHGYRKLGDRELIDNPGLPGIEVTELDFDDESSPDLQALKAEYMERRRLQHILPPTDNAEEDTLDRIFFHLDRDPGAHR